MNCYCGIDWAEGHHDVAIVGSDGSLVAKKRIGDDPGGFTAFTGMLADAGGAGGALQIADVVDVDLNDRWRRRNRRPSQNRVGEIEKKIKQLVRRDLAPERAP